MWRIGQYEILDVIGDGGMGTVYRGRDPRFDRPVAVKVLFDYLARNPEILDRFRKEAIIEARLQHPNIVTVYDFLVEGDVAAMVMELVDGRPLDEHLEKLGRPLRPAECLEILAQVLAAVGVAHAQGLVHRDIKPSNLMVRHIGRQIQVKVMDFGVAKILGEEKHRTATSAKMGTLAYCAPEQIRSPRDVDHRADIYSLGCTLYQMLTGRVPFDAESEYDLMKQVVSVEPPPPSRLQPSLGTALDAVVLRALAKDPRARFASCDELLDALQAAVANPPDRGPAPALVAPPAPEAGPPEGARPEPEQPSRRTLLIGGALAAALIFAIAVGALLSRRPTEAPAPPPDPGRSFAAPGTIVVRLTPPARAVLDSWSEPDAGQGEATEHRFSGLKARTYELRVWRDGYHQDVRNVSVAAGETRRLEIELRRR